VFKYHLRPYFGIFVEYFLKKLMKFKSLLTAFALLFTITINAQVELRSSGGSFEDLVPWGDGYLGVVQTQAYAVVLKSRQFQYFTENGDMKWNTKITGFNFNNSSVVHNESEYAYLVNMPFTKTALLEKTSKTELLNIHQVDKSGNVKEKSIKYTGEFKSLAKDVKKLEQCYLGAYKGGIIFVGTTDHKKHHVLKIDHDFNVTYNAINFDSDYSYELWEKDGISKVKFVLGEKDFSLIQLRHDEMGLNITVKTLDLENFVNVKEVKNTISFAGYTINSKGSVDIDYKASERVFTSYNRIVHKGQGTYIYSTLGAFTNFVYTDEGLKMYAYFKNIKEGTKRDIEKEGFLTFNMDLSGDNVISPTNEFSFASENGKSRGHAFHVTESGKFIIISKKSKSNIVLNSSEGEEITFEEDLSFAEIYLSYITGVKRSKTDQIDVICTVGDKFIGIDFEGFKNSLGNTKRALIYKVD